MQILALGRIDDYHLIRINLVLYNHLYNHYSKTAKLSKVWCSLAFYLNLIKVTEYCTKQSLMIGRKGNRLMFGIIFPFIIKVCTLNYYKFHISSRKCSYHSMILVLWSVVGYG